MKQEQLLKRLDNLEELATKLIHERNTLRDEKDKSLKEIKFLHNTIGELDGELNRFKNQEKISRIVTTITDDSQQNRELKQKLNEYIKVVDRCIAHLSL